MGRKSTYISHLGLIVEIISLQRRISRGGGQAAISLLENEPVSHKMQIPRETIDRCVDFGLRAGAWFGLLNSCLSRSAIRCILMRRSGIGARVAFGLQKEGGLLDGHCWVVEPGQADADPAGRQFKAIQIIPGDTYDNS